MTSGQVSAALLWFALSLPAAIAGQPGQDIDSLLAVLAREPPQSIAFTEIHSSALLDRELIVHGTLEYSGPGKLSRIITAPYEERIDIDGDRVRIHRAGRPERRFSLKRAPELGGLLTAFAALLGGDRAPVEREFELTLASGASGWQLTLTPRSARTRSRVMGIVVHGTGDAPTCIVTLTKDSGTATELLLGAAATGSDIAEQRASHCTALP